MSDYSIYVEGGRSPLKKALAIMTDDWIDAGQYCDDTVLDLRDVVVEQQAEIERLRGRLTKLRDLVIDMPCDCISVMGKPYPVRCDRCRALEEVGDE